MGDARITPAGCLDVFPLAKVEQITRRRPAFDDAAGPLLLVSVTWDLHTHEAPEGLRQAGTVIAVGAAAAP